MSEHTAERKGEGNVRGLWSYCKNWISAAGAVVATGSFFAFLLLFAFDTLTPDGSPYLGILTFLIAPAFLVFGLGLLCSGWLIQRYQERKGSAERSFLHFSLDFADRRERRKVLVFGGLAAGFLFLTALGSYHTYHFTESTEFCGEVCHVVMEPEYTTYITSPHARVDCVECHIGEGATWYVKSKVDGLYQVYATLRDIYPRPIGTPIESLRPAQETCEQCHWPQVFTGNLDRFVARRLSDEANTEYGVRLILKVGGGDPELGTVEGIHWHTDPRNKVEYIAVDGQRQDIPWVRLTTEGGDSRTFMKDGYTAEDLAGHEVRVMDCIDCHNRPAHILQSPNDAVDRSFSLGRLDPTYPDLKYTAVDLLTGGYETVAAAEAAIAKGLGEAYEGRAGLEAVIAEVQGIYRKNFFPQMKADWSVYPNNLGHKDWPGCFRCHGGEHSEEETGALMAANDCNACHTLLAQGSGEALLHLAPGGLEFAHPDGDVEGLLCSDCHTGALQ